MQLDLFVLPSIRLLLPMLVEIGLQGIDVRLHPEWHAKVYIKSVKASVMLQKLTKIILILQIVYRLVIMQNALHKVNMSY